MFIVLEFQLCELVKVIKDDSLSMKHAFGFCVTGVIHLIIFTVYFTSVSSELSSQIVRFTKDFLFSIKNIDWFQRFSSSNAVIDNMKKCNAINVFS